MEKRLLEKLVFDKRRELEMYDKQLEEYMRLSTQRAASGTTPLVPGGRAAWEVPALGTGAAASLAAPRPPVPSAAGGGVPSQKEVLQKLLAEKQLELQRASDDADNWAAEQNASYSAAAASVAPLSLDDRVRSLEEMLSAELARKEEQIALNEELVRINEEQVRANQELLRKLQASQALATAAASAAAADDDEESGPQPTYSYSAGDAAPPKTAAALAAEAKAAAAAKDDDMVLVQEDDGTQVLYRKLGRVLERPGGLGVVALGLVSSIPSAVAGAVNSIGSAAQKSETTRISRKRA